MSTTGAARAATALERIVGREHLCAQPEELEALAIDGVVPGMAISPGSVEEVTAVLRIANEHGLKVLAMGGQTRMGVGQIPLGVDVALRMGRLNDIESYDPGDLTIGVGAGARVADVQKLVAQNRQWLPMDVPRAARATIGGTLASGTAGPMAQMFGEAREFCIGVKFVTGDGRQGKGGGRVVKNVAGYDMMKLMIGSHGTLGVITSANFKLFPAPRQTRTFVAEFASLRAAEAFRSRIMRSPLRPICLEVVSPGAHAYLAEVSGANWSVLVRAGGSDAVLARYRTELGAEILCEHAGDSETALWNSICEFESAVLARHANAMTLELRVAPSDLGIVMEAAERVGLEQNLLPGAVGRLGAGSLVLAYIPISGDPPGAMQYVSAISALRAELPRDGSAIVTHCPLEVKRHVSVWGSPTGDIEVLRALKQALDENNVLSRGRFLF